VRASAPGLIRSNRLKGAVLMIAANGADTR